MVHFHVSHPFLDAGLLSSDLRALWTGASARHSQFTLTACLVFLVLSGSFPHPNPNSQPGGDQSTAPLLSSSEVFCTRYTHELPLRYFLKIAFYSPTISYKNGLSSTKLHLTIQCIHEIPTTNYGLKNSVQIAIVLDCHTLSRCSYYCVHPVENCIWTTFVWSTVLSSLAGVNFTNSMFEMSLPHSNNTCMRTKYIPHYCKQHWAKFQNHQIIKLLNLTLKLCVCVCLCARLKQTKCHKQAGWNVCVAY